MRIAASEYRNLDLWAHLFLRDVPLHDAFAIDLPGGGRGRTMNDIRALAPPGSAVKANPVLAALFKFRFFVGRILGWDTETHQLKAHSYVHRLDAEDRANSLAAAGEPDGPFRLLHLLPGESLSEIQNATVHAFLCQALRESDTGYRYYLGIYVKPVSRFTPLYMALIKPFRYWVVYPLILRGLKKAWLRKYGA